MKWYHESAEKCVRAFSSHETRGLAEREAEARQVTYGLNKLTEKKKTSLLVRFFMQFNDFMIIVLLSAAGVSFAMSLLNRETDFIDPLIILAIVILNAVLGLVQEYRAEKSIELLRKMTSPMAKVFREGHIQHIDAQYLVPGDLILIETGDMAPADARLLTAANLKMEEAALTGESAPVSKDADMLAAEDAPTGDRKNMIFAGCPAVYGHGTAIVTATGMSTEMGQIANMMMQDEEPETPLQKKLAQTGKTLGLAALCICGLIFAMGLFRHVPPFQMFMTSVSLAVAAIPEGLPAIVTIMLAIGVQRLASENAIVRRLPAVETLGSATVICSDKTGTLTQNKMTVVDLFTVRDKHAASDKKELLEYAALCNDTIFEADANSINLTGDPTETALVRAAYGMGLFKNALDLDMPRVAEVPFDSKRKCMTTVHQTKDEGYLVITKGAPDTLVAMCSHIASVNGVKKLSQPKASDILRQNADMASKALRVLAVGFKTVPTLPGIINENTIEHGLTFAGLIGMIDPPREEAKEAVALCKSAGIKPVMVTGDHVLTAAAIAKTLGIMTDRDNALTGDKLNSLPQETLEETIGNYAVFARVSPEHKMRIVKAFQAKGHVVAMTGDGVNDAPALKAADIGCAMGQSGTDVAKGAADMVLTDDNFATIVEAVRNGRGIYENIRKAVHFLLSSNIGEIITIFVSMLFGWASPLLAIHLLWVNLVTDSLPAIALGLDEADPAIMQRKPYAGDRSLFADGLWSRIICEGIMIGFLALVAFGVGHTFFDTPGRYECGRTMAFATLSISQLVHAFNMRSEGSLFKAGISGNPYLVGAFFAGLLLQCAVIMIPPLAEIFKVVPLGMKPWLVVGGLSTAPLFIVEAQKYFNGFRIKMENFDYIENV